MKLYHYQKNKKLTLVMFCGSPIVLMHSWYNSASYIYVLRHSVPGITLVIIPLWRQFGMFAIRNSSTRKSQTVSAFIRICIHLFDLKRKVRISSFPKVRNTKSLLRFHRFCRRPGWRRSSAKNALVSDSGNPSRCTRACRTRIIKGVDTVTWYVWVLYTW